MTSTTASHSNGQNGRARGDRRLIYAVLLGMFAGYSYLAYKGCRQSEQSELQTTSVQKAIAQSEERVIAKVTEQREKRLEPIDQKVEKIESKAAAAKTRADSAEKRANKLAKKQERIETVLKPVLENPAVVEALITATPTPEMSTVPQKEGGALRWLFR